MGDFIPQTPSLGTHPQTPSSLRAYRSFLSENSIKAFFGFLIVNGRRFPCGCAARFAFWKSPPARL